MRTIIQRVSECTLKVNGEIVSQIDLGLLLLCGYETEDTLEDIQYCINKSINMRIFNDHEDKMNLSVQDVNGQIMIVSQFTLHAKTKKGNRPSFIEAARPEIAIPLYQTSISLAEEVLGKEKIKTGIFGADMKISLLNDGPVTIILDSKNKDY